MRRNSGRTGLSLLLVAAALSIMSASAGARLIRGEVLSLRQPDGTFVDLRVWGDEYYGVTETLDGYTVVRDPDTFMFTYARLSDDGRDLVSTGVPVGSALRAAQIQKHLRVPQDVAAESARVAREDFDRRAYDDVNAPSATRAERGPTTGAVEGIVLLIDFSDDSATVATSSIDDYCNLPGYTGFGNNGSVRDYFYDVSDGALTYTNYVPTAYYRASRPKSYYTDPSVSYGTRARELIVEALTDMDANGFDFSLYDADGNGVIDAINCFYAGGIWNNWAEGLWPHAWTVSFYADGVSSYRYQITDLGSQPQLSTFCHENGHMLMGWPDLYDYDYDSSGVGRYCLMCNSGSSTNPIEPCAYMKYDAGWASVTSPSTPQTGLTISSDSNDIYKFSRPGHSNEYYLLENRQKSGRDAVLLDSGLAIWHIDTYGDNSNQQQTPSSHYLVTLVQADGDWDLENGVNYGDNTDLYAAPSYTDCTPFTDPDTDWWDGSESGLSFSNIGASGTVMTFDYGDAPPSTPSNVTATGGELHVAVDWSPVFASDFDYYLVERDTTALFAAAVSATTTDTTYTDYPLVEGEEYFYRVTAVDLGGLSSSPSATVSATPTGDMPPSAPTGLLALGGGDAVELVWDENPEPDVSGYQIIRDVTPAFASPETLGVVAGAGYTDSAMTSGSAWWYAIRAEDGPGSLSPRSDEVAGIAVPGIAVYVDDSSTACQNGSLSCPYQSIQDGIDDAVSGDVVIIFPGSYWGAVQLKDGVSIVGMKGAGETEITSGITALGIGSASTVKGISVNGLGAVGTGLDCQGSDVTIEDCSFTATTNAGVSYHHGSGGVLSRCSFSGNQTAVSCADSAAPHIASNTFQGNTFANLTSMGVPGPTVGGSMDSANDFLDYGYVTILNGAATTLSAEYNYWGDECVEAGWFSGAVDYTPWVDSTHTMVYEGCWVGVPGGGVPDAVYATRSYPNPLNPRTSIAFGLPDPGGDVSVKVYSASGRLVRTLVDGYRPAGRHIAEWDGTDERGESVSSGVYFYRIEGPGLASGGKMTVLK